MMINVEYQPHLKELARASLLFAEKKPFIMFSVALFNLCIGFFFLAFVIKMYMSGLTLNEILCAVACAVILFGRKPLNQWILLKRMQNSKAIEKPILVEITMNGIVWSGKGLRQGHMAWKDIKYMMETKNGYIMPNAMTKFLWLPFRGFKSTKDIENLQKIIVEKKIVLRVFPKYEC
jgi:hypothetical protein